MKQPQRGRLVPQRLKLSEMEVMVPGLDKANVLVCGADHQVDKRIWSKDNNDTTTAHLKKRESPTCQEPLDEPQPTKPGEVITTAQLKRHKLKVSKCLKGKEDW